MLPVEDRHICLTDSEVEIMVKVFLVKSEDAHRMLGSGPRNSLEQSEGTIQTFFFFFNLIHLPSEWLLNSFFNFLVWKYFAEKQKSKDARKVADKLGFPTGNLRDLVTLSALSLPALGCVLGQSVHGVASIRKDGNTNISPYFLTIRIQGREWMPCSSLSFLSSTGICLAFPQGLIPQTKLPGRSHVFEDTEMLEVFINTTQF